MGPGPVRGLAPVAQVTPGSDPGTHSRVVRRRFV